MSQNLKISKRSSDKTGMTLSELFNLRTQMLHEFEKKFEAMTFKNEMEKKNYYHAYMEGMTEFFNSSMFIILDKDDLKAA